MTKEQLISRNSVDKLARKEYLLTERRRKVMTIKKDIQTYFTSLCFCHFFILCSFHPVRISSSNSDLLPPKFWVPLSKIIRESWITLICVNSILCKLFPICCDNDLNISTSFILLSSLLIIYFSFVTFFLYLFCITLPPHHPYLTFLTLFNKLPKIPFKNLISRCTYFFEIYFLYSKEQNWVWMLLRIICYSLIERHKIPYYYLRTKLSFFPNIKLFYPLILLKFSPTSNKRPEFFRLRDTLFQ